MIAQSWTIIEKLLEQVKTRWYLRVLCYALIAAAVFTVWLLSDGESVAFVYSEF